MKKFGAQPTHPWHYHSDGWWLLFMPTDGLGKFAQSMAVQGNTVHNACGIWRTAPKSTKLRCVVWSSSSHITGVMGHILGLPTYGQENRAKP